MFLSATVEHMRVARDICIVRSSLAQVAVLPLSFSIVGVNLDLPKGQLGKLPIKNTAFTWYAALPPHGLATNRRTCKNMWRSRRQGRMRDTMLAVPVACAQPQQFNLVAA
jgi:hypothetical protein